MSDNRTPTWIRKRFELVAHERGWPLCDHKLPVKDWNGKYAIQHNTYSGWAVVRYVNESGAEKSLCMAMSKHEICAWFDGALCKG